MPRCRHEADPSRPIRTRWQKCLPAGPSWGRREGKAGVVRRRTLPGFDLRPALGLRGRGELAGCQTARQHARRGGRHGRVGHRAPGPAQGRPAFRAPFYFHDSTTRTCGYGDSRSPSIARNSRFSGSHCRPLRRIRASGEFPATGPPRWPCWSTTRTAAHPRLSPRSRAADCRTGRFIGFACTSW